MNKTKKKSPSTFRLFLRSLAFSVLLITVTIPYSLACIIALPLPLKARYKLVTGWTNLMVWLLKNICYIEYKVEGLENLPMNGVGVVLSKHQSAWETFFMPKIFPFAAIIVKKELLWIPFFGWGLASVQPIAIKRTERSSAMAQILQKGTECLAAGRWVVVFPEGTRISPGHRVKYRLGGARLAVHAGYPVIPLAHNAGRYWPKRKFIKRPGIVRVVIGPPIMIQDRTPEVITALASDWIEDTVTRIDAESGW